MELGRLGYDGPTRSILLKRVLHLPQVVGLKSARPARPTAEAAGMVGRPVQALHVAYREVSNSLWWTSSWTGQLGPRHLANSHEDLNHCVSQ